MVGTPPPPPAQANGEASRWPRGGDRRVRSRSRGRSRVRRQGGEAVVRETIVREIGGGGRSVSWTTLTKPNYTEWAILMRVKLQGAGLCEAIDPGNASERQER